MSGVPSVSRLAFLWAAIVPSRMRATLAQGYRDGCDLATCRQSLRGAQEQNDLLRNQLALEQVETARMRNILAEERKSIL